MPSALRPLSVQDVGKLLEQSSRARDAILVGGQALNVWAGRFDLAPGAALVSDDIDFYTSRADAVAAGLDWKAKVLTPGLDEHTPKAVVVIVEIDDEERGIDFMSSIAGVNSQELSRWASTVRGRNYAFHVMHPLHVLQSQLENGYGMLSRRNEEGGEYYAARAHLAVKVTAAAVAELLDTKRVREALKAAERIASLAQKPPSHEAHRKDGIDVMNAIPPHQSWPKEFIARRLPQLSERVAGKRRRYSASV